MHYYVYTYYIVAFCYHEATSIITGLGAERITRLVIILICCSFVENEKQNFYKRHCYYTKHTQKQFTHAFCLIAFLQYSSTPLDTASCYGSLHVVHVLLQRGAKVDSRDRVRQSN